MGKLKREQFIKAEGDAKDYLENYAKYVEDVQTHNDEVEEELKKTDGKVPEVERKSYSQDRKEAKEQYKLHKEEAKPANLRKKTPKVRKTTAQIREEKAQEQRVMEQNKTETYFEKRKVSLNEWAMTKYSAIHAQESGMETNLFPSTKEGKKKDVVTVRGGIQGDTVSQKIGLYKAIDAIDSKRSIFSKIFNWAEDYRVYKAKKVLKDSLMQDNGISKEQLKSALKFACKDKDKLDKFDNFDGIDNNGKTLLQAEEESIVIGDNLHGELNQKEYEEEYKEVQDKLDRELEETFEEEEASVDGEEVVNDSQEASKDSQDLSETLY